MLDPAMYTPEFLRAEAPDLFEVARASSSVEDLREKLSHYAYIVEFETLKAYDLFSEGTIIRVRDCARTLFRALTHRSEKLAGFSLVQALWDLSRDIPRPDLTPGFIADLVHIFWGIRGKGPQTPLSALQVIPAGVHGRDAAIERSRQLDDLASTVDSRMERFATGLTEEAQLRREARKKKILRVLRGTELDWNNWQWHLDHIVRDADLMSLMVDLSTEEKATITAAKERHLPFAVTPYYLSLIDDAPDGRDRAIRAQVIPTPGYVKTVGGYSREQMACMDFMKEGDTSPADLVTRRYPSICIFKPFNTCPQICVYCQRNWEIEDAMEPGALASDTAIHAALDWIRAHPAIHEVLITGGDPLAMSDEQVEKILQGVLDIPTIERIRFGSRTLVTMPMRITDRLVEILASGRIPGKRQIALVTHIEHAYEVTPATAMAVDKLRRAGIPVYNQLVYTFYVSRRFEAARLRRTLSLIGIDPYYSFNTKGKEETSEYRVPIARLLQEQKEEARLLPGLSRTDEPVYNVPGLGKNYLRARQHRDLIAFLPNGARLFEFHSWEKNVSADMVTYVGEDVPILDYLQRLEAIGEDAADYDTIWYYV